MVPDTPVMLAVMALAVAVVVVDRESVAVFVMVSPMDIPGIMDIMDSIVTCLICSR